MALFTFYPGAVAYVAAGKQFYDLVKDRGPWDFKHLIKDRLGEGITLCSGAGCRTDVDYGVPGNIHFGFVASEGGYYSWEIQAGAGIAEVFDPAHDPDSPESAGYAGEFSVVFTPAGPSLNLGDDPDDNNDVAFGIHLYRTYGRGMTQAQFRRELETWLSSLKDHPPDNRPVRQDVQQQYPYPVDYFNPS